MIQNSWTNFLAVNGLLNNGQMYETRMFYDGGGLLEYVGLSKTPNASTSEPIWFILKLSNDGTNTIRQQLPDNGVSFTYVLDDRSTYFS